MFGQIGVLLILHWTFISATPTGNHTCFGVIKHPVTVRVNVTEPVTYRTYTWCLRVPPRCSKYTVQLRDRVKVQTEMHNKTITVCCKGYVEMDYKCVPACPPFNECPNMHCNRTNHCYCTPGYMGLYCNEPCHRGFWGKDCQRACDCPEGYTCHHLTGDCMLDDSPPKRAQSNPTISEAKTTNHLVTQINPIEISEALKAESTKISERPATKVSTTQMTATSESHKRLTPLTTKRSIDLAPIVKVTTVEPEKPKNSDEIEVINFGPMTRMIKSTTPEQTTAKPMLETSPNPKLKPLDPAATPEPGRTTRIPAKSPAVRTTTPTLWSGRRTEGPSFRSTKPTLNETIARNSDKEIRTTQETSIPKTPPPKELSAFAGKSGEDENDIMKLLEIKSSFKNSRVDTLSHPTLKSESKDNNILNLSHSLNGINEFTSNNNIKETHTEKTTNYNYSLIKLSTTTENTSINDQKMRKTINIYDLKSDEHSDNTQMKPVERINLNQNRLESNSTVRDVQPEYSRNRLNTEETEESKHMIDLLQTEPLSAGVQSQQSEEAVRHFLSGLTFTLGCITMLTIIVLTLVIFRKCKNKRDKCMMDEVIMAYAPPSESTNPLIYNTSNYSVLRYGEAQPTFFCPTFTNTYAERLNRELHELNYDHPRSIAEPLYAEISN